MYFCLNCLTGKEEETKAAVSSVLTGLTDCDFLVWFPMKECREKRGGKFETVSKPLFPSYLFIWWDCDDELKFPFYEVKRIPAIIRFLGYDNGSFALVGKDQSFAEWIHMHDGNIRTSKVVFREGQRVHIVEGPLRGFDGNVIKVDKHHRRIVLRFDVGGIISDVSFSVEFLSSGAAKPEGAVGDIR